MYLLDTNVVSELRKAKIPGRCSQNLLDWIKTASPGTLFLSAITILELEMGVLLLERKDPIQGELIRKWLENHVIPTFQGRVISVDLEVARCCADLHVPDPRSDRDALIGATAKVHSMTLVTRNIRDFDGMGIRVLNPWEKINF